MAVDNPHFQLVFFPVMIQITSQKHLVSLVNHLIPFQGMAGATLNDPKSSKLIPKSSKIISKSSKIMEPCWVQVGPRGHPPSHASDQTQCPSGTSVSGGKLTAFNGNSGDLMVINNGSINGDFSWFKNGLTMVNNQNIHGIYPLVIEHSYRTY